MKIKAKFDFKIFLLLITSTIIFAEEPNIEEPSDVTNVIVEKTVLTPNKKNRLEFLKHDFYDPRCIEEFPVSLDREAGICQIRIYDTIENKVNFRLIAGDEQSPSYNRCPNVSFPFSIAYGFHSLSDENIRFFTELGWFGVDDRDLTYYDFNWKTCETVKLWKYSEAHCPDYCNFTTFITIKNEKYVFYYNQFNQSIDGEKLISKNNLNTNSDEFSLFFKQGKEFPILRKKIPRNLFRIPLKKWKDTEDLKIHTSPDFPNLQIYINESQYFYNFQDQKLIRIKVSK